MPNPSESSAKLVASLSSREFVPKGFANVSNGALNGGGHSGPAAEARQSGHGSEAGSTGQSARFDTNPLYKTELCRSYEEFGQCRYGNKCQFAHSLEELRPVQRHPKYKTEVCKTFATTGTCPYGTRCRFIHQTRTLAQLQTAKAESGRDDASVYSASMSGMSTPVPVSPHAAAVAMPHGFPDDNPLSFANVTKGASKTNRGIANVASMASLASRSVSGVPSSNGGSLVGSVVGSPAMGNYLDAVKDRRAGSAAISINAKGRGHSPVDSNVAGHADGEPESVHGTTALVAALDVLNVRDEANDPAGSHAGSLQNGGSIFGSLEDRHSFLRINTTELGLGDLDESILGTSADISGSSLMAHMGNKERRLPVFSNFSGEDENPAAEKTVEKTAEDEEAKKSQHGGHAR
jgi:hypothetical protein